MGISIHLREEPRKQCWPKVLVLVLGMGVGVVVVTIAKEGLEEETGRREEIGSARETRCGIEVDLV